MSGRSPSMSTSPSRRRTTRPCGRSTPPRSPRATRTTAVPASAPCTTRATTARSSWTPTGTTSRSSTTTSEPWLALSLIALGLLAAPAHAATAWAPPTELARADKFVAPLVAVDPSGAAVAAWTRFLDGSAYATRPADGPWGPTQTNEMPGDPDETFLQPGLSDDDAGNATVVRFTSSGGVEGLFRPPPSTTPGSRPSREEVLRHPGRVLNLADGAQSHDRRSS